MTLYYLAIILRIVFLMAFSMALFYTLTSPKQLYDFIKSFYRLISRTKLKSVTVDGKNMVYLEGKPKSKKVIVLLHGITADKYMWPFFAVKFVLKGYRVIIPDLPPFGESEYDESIKYSIDYQARNLKKFLDKIDVNDKIHLAGNSMGGGVAAKLAILYPDFLKSLILFDNMGIYSVERTEFLNNIESGGRNYLLVQNKDDLEKMLKLVYYKLPFIPNKIKKELLREGILNHDKNKKVFDDLLEEEWYMENDLSKIETPTYIIWGDKDKVFHVSSADVLKKGIKNSKVDIIKSCGHLPMNEKASLTSKKVLEFIKELENGQ